MPFSPVMSPARGCIDTITAPPEDARRLDAVVEGEENLLELNMIGSPTSTNRMVSTHTNVATQDLLSPARPCVYNADTSHHYFEFGENVNEDGDAEEVRIMAKMKKVEKQESEEEQ
jgi:hypothetical protein